MQKRHQLLVMMLIISTFAQAQWTKVTTPFTTFPAVGQSLYAKDNTVLCVSSGNQANFSLDAGKNWTAITLPDIFAFPTQVAMTAKKMLVSTSNQIYASSDKGNTWKLDYNPSGANVFSVLQNTTFAATKNGIIAYNESSSLWESAGLTAKNIIHLENDGTNLFAFELKSNGDYVTHRSADKGKTWTLPSNLYVPSGIAKAGNVLYATYGSSFGIATSIDNGVTWTQNNLTNLPSSVANAAISINDTLYVSFKGGAFDPALGFYRYDAKSNTWAKLNNGLAATETNLVRLAYNGNGTLWAMQRGEFSSGGALWRNKIGKQTVDSKQLVLDTAIDLQLSPNPVTSVLYLTVSPDKVLTGIKIMNLQGQTLLSQGNQQVIDIATLAKGVYILEATTTEGSTRKRVIKL
jgi:hypothetical protein